MRFTCKRAAFAAALACTARAINPKALLPILRCVTLCAREKQVDLMATDFAIMIIISLPAAVSESGAITVPCAPLRAYVKLLDEGVLTCSDAPPDRSVALTIEQGNTQAAFNGILSSDAPAMPLFSPTATALTVQGEHLAQALQQAAACVGTASYQHSGWDPAALVLLSFESAGTRFTCVGTDRHILAYAHLDIRNAPEQPLRRLLSAKVAQQLSALLPPGECLMQWEGDMLALRTETMTCYARFSRDADVTTYPDYHGLLAALPDLTVQVERAQLIASITRCKGAILTQTAGKDVQAILQVVGRTLLLRVQATDTVLAMHSLEVLPIRGFDEYECVTIVLPWNDLGQLVEPTTGKTPHLSVSLERNILMLSGAPNSGVMAPVEVQSIVKRAVLSVVPGREVLSAPLSSIGSRAQVAFGNERDLAVHVPRKSRATWPDNAALWEGNI